MDQAKILNPDDFFALLFLNDSQLEKFSAGAKLHTDDWPILGLKSPFSLYSFYAPAKNLAELTRFREGAIDAAIVFEHESQKEEFRRREQARDTFIQGLLLMADEKYEAATGQYEQALELYPEHTPIKEALRPIYVFLEEKHKKAGNSEKAEEYARKLKEL